MQLNEAIELAGKLAHRIHTDSELIGIVSFLKTASREQAMEFLHHYQETLSTVPGNHEIDEPLLQRLQGIKFEEVTVIPLKADLQSAVNNNSSTSFESVTPIESSIDLSDPFIPVPSVSTRIHFLKTAWFRYAAAVILIVEIGAYLYITNQKESPSVCSTSAAPRTR